MPSINHPIIDHQKCSNWFNSKQSMSKLGVQKTKNPEYTNLEFSVSPHKKINRHKLYQFGTHKDNIQHSHLQRFSRQPQNQPSQNQRDQNKAIQKIEK